MDDPETGEHLVQDVEACCWAGRAQEPIRVRGSDRGERGEVVRREQRVVADVTRRVEGPATA